VVQEPFFSQYYGFSLLVSFHQCSILIFELCCYQKDKREIWELFIQAVLSLPGIGKQAFKANLQNIVARCCYDTDGTARSNFMRI
jgi:hypothetical protein